MRARPCRTEPAPRRRHCIAPAGPDRRQYALNPSFATELVSTAGPWHDAPVPSPNCRVPNSIIFENRPRTTPSPSVRKSSGQERTELIADGRTSTSSGALDINRAGGDLHRRRGRSSSRRRDDDGRLGAHRDGPSSEDHVEGRGTRWGDPPIVAKTTSTPHRKTRHLSPESMAHPKAPLGLGACPIPSRRHCSPRPGSSGGRPRQPGAPSSRRSP